MMRKIVNYSLLGLGIFLFFACNSAEKQSEIPVIDVTKTYPEKKIVLQDIADVEYIPLETRDDVLLEEYAKFQIVSSDTIIVGNLREGSIIIFDGKGKIINHFNRKGQSGEEYQAIWGISFDKESKEIYVLDYPHRYRFQVYDEKGNYKRTLSIDNKYSFNSAEILHYDNETLLCYDRENILNRGVDSIATNQQPFTLISKKDGKLVKKLPLILSQRIDPNITIKQEGGMSVYWANLHTIIRNGKDFIFSEISKDTIFNFSKDEILTPMVVRTPEILKMNEPLFILQITKVLPKYIFGKIFEKKQTFPERNILIDRETNKIYVCYMVNEDIKDVEFSVLLDIDDDSLLSADELLDLLEEGKLSGKLKEIAEKLSPEDNPVLVKVKFKE